MSWAAYSFATTVAVAGLDADLGRDLTAPACDQGLGDDRVALGRWVCTRRPEHQGRHLACVFVNGRPFVAAAWPGDAEPSAADLEAVPS